MAEPIRAVTKMARPDRLRLEKAEADLVREAVKRRSMQSALDLDDSAQIEEFLVRTLGVVDIFAFPLTYEDKVRAVLVLYLSMESDVIRDADIHGLMSIGELLALAGEARGDGQQA